ncbi:MAG: hypothetical protein HKN05_14000 [Rhizobiales bacterium]|nr:hypothetical protein [Hyphomicrobiales bacterium]
MSKADRGAAALAMGLKRLFALVLVLMVAGLGGLWAYETGRTIRSP